MLISFYVGCDQYMVKRDETGKVALSDMYNDKMLTITQKLYDLFYTAATTHICGLYGPASAESKILMDTGRCLFSVIPLKTAVKIYRQSDVDFGILPFPKYDEPQDGSTFQTTGAGPMCIPAVAQNTELIGMTCELLGLREPDDHNACIL